MPPREPLRRRCLAAVVEAHSVDDGAVLRQPEQPGRGVTVLRTGRQRAHFYKAEALPEHGVRHLRVLVEPRRKPDRRGEIQPRHTCAQRSEEHTSELKSLMRISYAVFCLKNKTV